MNERRKLGLLGRNISYSFSRTYFLNKFKELELSSLSYTNFDIPEIDEFPFLLYHKEHEFIGMNVTIPYKESVIRYLNEISPEAKEIGAVNVIKVNEYNELIGYNTDAYGFEKAIKPMLGEKHKSALILGTGGASKAIAFVLKKMNIPFQYVSRTEGVDRLTYSELTSEIITDNKLIINCTPLGTYPGIDEKPSIPYDAIGEDHLLFDLVYNPPLSAFLKEGDSRGAAVKNGYEMLEQQAEKAWEIWNFKE